jgi:hypothetical protein
MLRDAAGKGAQFAGLPEVFRTKFFCRPEDAGRGKNRGKKGRR